MIMDQESRDANSLLVELDRGLQSSNIGDQSEAVVRFTRLFQRYPLPLLINSAFLKLAEAFRNGSNFIRVQICEVFERNQNHLNKVNNVNEFYRNIFTVTTSNDPIARSIALLTLGNIAPIVSAHRDIHHCISNTLETATKSELSAAITCAACYVKQSLEFARNIYPKIVSIIDSPQYPIEVKLRSLSVLDHEFYNANAAVTVRLFLIDVMKKSQLKRLTCTCLTLSTKIAYNSLSHILPQIELLLDMFFEDPRHVIKMNALRNLKFLAEKSPHIWESSHVNPLVSYLEDSLSKTKSGPDDGCLYAILTIFCKLLTCHCNFIGQQEKTRIYDQCYIIANDSRNMHLSSMAFELLTVMYEEYSYSSCEKIEPDQNHTGQELIENTFSAIKSFIMISFPNIKHKKSKGDSVSSNKAIYRHIVRLCQLNPQFSIDLMKLIFDKMSKKTISIRELCPYVTELMCAITSLLPEPVIEPKNCAEIIRARVSELCESNLLYMIVLYFQLLRLQSSRYVGEDLIADITQDKTLIEFRVMRQAMRYGHHKQANILCSRLKEFVTSVTINYYFDSIGKICYAETKLNQNDNDLSSNLRQAITIYEESVSPFRASIVTNFQLQFLSLRIKTLQAHNALRQYHKVYAGRGPDGFSRLMSIAKDFRILSDCYENLASGIKDNSTQNYIQLLRFSCLIMSIALDKNNFVNKLRPPKSNCIEHRDLVDVCNKLTERILNPNKSAIDLLECSDEIIRCPFSFPKLFFQADKFNLEPASLSRSQIN